MTAHATHLSQAPAPAALPLLLYYGHHRPGARPLTVITPRLPANRCEPAPGDRCGPWLASRAGPARGLVGPSDQAQPEVKPPGAQAVEAVLIFGAGDGPLSQAGAVWCPLPRQQWTRRPRAESAGSLRFAFRCSRSR